MLHTAWTTLTCTAVFPPAVLANTITTLTAVFMGRLVLGNFIIGIVEGLIIARLLSAARIRSIWIMVLANYVSMFGGLILINLLGMVISYGLFARKALLYNAFYVILFMPILAFVMTVLMEWPFCHQINPHKPKSQKRSLKACVIAQLASYALILPLYLLSSNISLYLDTSFDRSLSFAENPTARIYYISSEDNCIYCCRTDGTGIEKIPDQQTAGLNDLFIWPNRQYQTLELWYGADLNPSSKRDLRKKILDDIPWNGSLPTWYRTSHYGMAHGESIEESREYQNQTTDEKYNDKIESFYLTNEIADYRPLEQRDWIVTMPVFFNFGDGLMAKHPTEGLIDLTLKTPYLNMGTSNVTVLPGNQVVFQLGMNQIVLFDLDSRKIGLVARGRSPVVVFENPPANPNQ